MDTTIDSPAVGTIMPDIAVIDPTGSARSLRQLVAGRRALVYFMRSASCPVCNAHLRTIAGMGLADAAVVVVTPGGAAEAAAVASRVALDVVASGESGHAAVGLGRFLGLQHSGSFVLDADARILSARTATLPTGSFDRSEVAALLG